MGGPFAFGGPASARHIGEDLARGEEAVEGGRETGIDGHLHQDLDDLRLGEADIQPGADMDLQLRRSIPERGQSGDGCDFAAAQIEPGTRIDVAERELEQISGEVGSNVGQRLDDSLSGCTVDFSERALSARVAVVRVRMIRMEHD